MAVFTTLITENNIALQLNIAQFKALQIITKHIKALQYIYIYILVAYAFKCNALKLKYKKNVML